LWWYNSAEKGVASELRDNYRCGWGDDGYG